MPYELIKALHIISVVAWFAGLFYLPRLYVYHVNAPKAAHEMLCTMEFKLFRYIMSPAMTATYVFGIWMLIEQPFLILEFSWMHIKLTLILVLTAYNHYLGALRKGFVKGENKHSEKFYRMINEVPTLVLITVVILAVMKPF